MIGQNVKLYGDVRLGRGVIIEDNVVIGHPSAVEIAMFGQDRESFPNLEAFYQEAAKSPTLIGDNAYIRSNTVIYSGVRVGANLDCAHFVLIREGCVLGDNVYLKAFTHLMKDVTVGDDCRIAATIADNSFLGDRVSCFGTLTHKNPKRSRSDKGPWPGVVVGNDCLIGRGSVVLGPAQLGNNCTIGANSFVNFDVDEGTFIAGPIGLKRS